MRNFKKNLACACTLVVTLSNVPVKANVINYQPLAISAESVLKDIAVSEKEEFINSINKVYTIDTVHGEELNYIQWIEKDLEYLNNQITNFRVDKTKLESEIKSLKEKYAELDKIEKPVVRGVIVEPYHITAFKDAILCALDIREELIYRVDEKTNLDGITYLNYDFVVGGDTFKVYDKTNGNENLRQASPMTANQDLLDIFYPEGGYESIYQLKNEDIDKVAEVIYDAINVKEIPDSLLKNLRMYVSPYRFLGYKGFTTGSNLIGREEMVVIGLGEDASYNTILDTVVHELGHVYAADILGRQSGAKSDSTEYIQDFDKWSQYKKMVAGPEYDKLMDSDDKSEYMNETIAEHFRIAIFNNSNLDATKASKIEYSHSKQLENSIYKDLCNYKNVETHEIIPQIFINGEKLVSGKYNMRRFETFRRDDAGNISLRIETNKEDSGVEYTYSLYKRVGDSAEVLFKNKPIENETLDELMKLDAGEYALTINSKIALYSFIDFYVK